VSVVGASEGIVNEDDATAALGKSIILADAFTQKATAFAADKA
jgi:hypothetical protein